MPEKMRGALRILKNRLRAACIKGHREKNQYRGITRYTAFMLKRTKPWDLRSLRKEMKTKECTKQTNCGNDAHLSSEVTRKNPREVVKVAMICR